LSRPADLPDPDSNPDADVVIFDGVCKFCRAQVGRLRRLDLRGDRLTFLSLHDPRVSERYPDLTHETLMEQMFVIDSSGRRHGGADAVRYLSRRLPAIWILAPLLHIPFSAGLWRWCYRQIAKRRYKLAGKSCENDACRIHFD
jgi:predicted DCC family thiol-disulfide oxidoreductase YuxK